MESRLLQHLLSQIACFGVKQISVLAKIFDLLRPLNGKSVFEFHLDKND